MSKTKKQILLSHIKNWHHRQPAKGMTVDELSRWHARQHHYYTHGHYHEGMNKGPDQRPLGWYTGENAVIKKRI